MDKDQQPDLEHVQAAGRRMLACLDGIAQAHRLRYFVAYGTALGAVRDQRQIPWDWDMDVLVPTPDYSRLISTLRAALPHDLRVVDHASQPGYGPLFARIAPTSQDHWAVHLDIFPLAGAPSRTELRPALIRFNRIWSRIHLLKTERPAERLHYSRAKRIIARGIRLLSWPLPQTAVRRAFWLLNGRWSYDTADVVFNPCGPYAGREFFPAEWFRDACEGELSGVTCRLPIEADQMLKALYGDYMTPIPTRRQEQELQFFEDYVRPQLLPEQQSDDR